MVVSASYSTVASLFKINYPDPSDIVRQVLKDQPTLGMIKRNKEFGGLVRSVPCIFSNIQNTGATLQSSTATYGNIYFQVTRATNTNVASISNDVFLASRMERSSLFNQQKLNMDLGLGGLGSKLATQLFRSSTGSVCQISSTATVNSSSTPVQLTPGSSANLEWGMNIDTSQTDGSTPRTSSGAFIVYLDKDNDTFLCSATYGGSPAALSSLITSVAASDYVLISSSDSNAAISGFPAWLPGLANVASNDSFFSVNRYKDTKLAGHYFDASASNIPIQEAFYRAGTLVARDGGKIDHFACSFDDYQRLALSLGNNVRYVDVNSPNSDVDFSFKTISVNLPTGIAAVVPDRACPVGTAYGLQLNTWELGSIGEVAQLMESDGLVAIRDASADLLNMRFVSYANLYCNAPGFNIQIKLPS